MVEKEEQWRGRNDCDYIKPDLSKSRSAPKLDLAEPIQSPYDVSHSTSKFFFFGNLLIYLFS